jgi:hypothetical protein
MSASERSSSLELGAGSRRDSGSKSRSCEQEYIVRRLRAHTCDLRLLHRKTGGLCLKLANCVEEKVHSAAHKKVPSTSAFRFADARHFRVGLRSRHHPHIDMLKPRLFSTLRRLQHENPLVRVFEDIDSVMADVAGSSALWHSSANAADAARTTTKKEHQKREESHCCLLCKGRSGQEYDCWYAASRLSWTLR